MTDAPQAPYDHDREKLRRMALANRTEIEAIKALQLAGKHVDRWRVFKLQRAVKVQAKFEQELRRRAERCAAALARLAAVAASIPDIAADVSATEGDGQ